MVKQESTSEALQPLQTPDAPVEPSTTHPADGDPDSVENLRAMVLSKVPGEPSATYVFCNRHSRILLPTEFTLYIPIQANKIPRHGLRNGWCWP